jgi:hypothetical protein
MTTSLIFLLVEGRHDAEFMARLLKLRGFELRDKLSTIPKHFHKLFPDCFPANHKTRLTQPHPVPGFYEAEGKWLVMLIGGGGESAPRLRNALRTAGINGYPPDAIGVVIDQDQFPTPIEARDAFIIECQRKEGLSGDIDLRSTPGTIVEGSPRTGLFVLPDNLHPGALEDVLLECGETNYKQLKDRALAFRNEALTNCGLLPQDTASYGESGGQKDISKRKKAWVSAMGSILVPAAAIQNSIRDNRWVDGDALELPSVRTIAEFLDNLIERRSHKKSL